METLHWIGVVAFLLVIVAGRTLYHWYWRRRFCDIFGVDPRKITTETVDQVFTKLQELRLRPLRLQENFQGLPLDMKLTVLEVGGTLERHYFEARRAATVCRVL